MLSNSKNKPLANKETKDRRTRPPVSLTVKTFVRLSQHLILAWFPPASERQTSISRNPWKSSLEHRRWTYNAVIVYKVGWRKELVSIVELRFSRSRTQVLSLSCSSEPSRTDMSPRDHSPISLYIPCRPCRQNKCGTLHTRCSINRLSRWPLNNPNDRITSLVLSTRGEAWRVGAD